jgi:flavin-binding protein dodecin
MTERVYKSLELTGSSSKSVEDAVNNAIAKAAETLRNVRCSR